MARESVATVSSPDNLLERLRRGERECLGPLFARHRERLWRMVDFRLDPRIRGRVDADDVLQEAFLAASKRLDHYLEKPQMSFFIWLRLIVNQTLVDVHRTHLGAKARDAAREVPALVGGGRGTSTSLAIQLVGNLTSPTQAAARAETYRLLEDALDSMDSTDREILALRHFEELTNGEVAEVLGIREKAASIRYVRALGRLRKILSRIPGFSPGSEATS